MFLSGLGAFLAPSYWINPNPVPLGSTLALEIFGFFVFFIAASLALLGSAHVLRHKDKLLAGLLRRFAGPIGVTGAFGILFLFFAYEQSPFLGMRFWFLLTFAYLLVRLAMVAAWCVRDYPALRAEREEQERLGKWLPHKK